MFWGSEVFRGYEFQRFLKLRKFQVLRFGFRGLGLPSRFARFQDLPDRHAYTSPVW